MTIKQNRKTIIIGILVSVVALFIIATYWYNRSVGSNTLDQVSTQTTKPLPSSEVGGNLKPNSIVPGISTEEEVTQELGQPTIIEGGVSQFKSNHPVFNNQATFSEEGELVFFKEIITFKKEREMSDITNTFGKPPYELFGESSSFGDNLFVYPEQGIAFVGNTLGETLTEVWYFKPTNIADFMNTWGEGWFFTEEEAVQERGHDLFNI